MHWIKTPKTIIVAVITGTLLLGGCATQETILPPSERKMADIYREAMDAVAAPVAATFDPEAICASLDLEEGTEACRKTLADHAKTVYRQIDSLPETQALDYIAYTRTTRSELDNLFPRLQNPDLVIYVYPHLATRTRAPIPGYTTVVPLYERVEYRLPGEALLATPIPASASREEGAQ